MERGGVQVNITTVSVFELYVGLNLGTKPIEEKNKIDNVLGNIVVINFDFNSAREAAEIFSDRKRRELTIDPEDAIIAGICISNEEPILTRNIDHFSNIDGLSVESY